MIRPASGASPAGSKGRILLLSYHFPPGQTAGALRWQKMVEFVCDAGWEVDVVAREPNTAMDEDAWGDLEGLPSSVRFFGVEDSKHKVDEVVAPLLSVANWIRGTRIGGTQRSQYSRVRPPPTAEYRVTPTSLSSSDIEWRPIRDAPRRAFGATYRLAVQGTWAARAGTVAKKLVSESGDYKALITCGPPHAIHVTGARIARRSSIPHILDLRDPWRFLERLHEPIASPVWTRVSAISEESCVRSAALMILNTPAAARRYREEYSSMADRIISVPNGCDTIHDRHKQQRSGPLTVLFAGSIYLDRDPAPFFQGAGQMIRSLQVTPSEFRLVFVGLVESFEGTPTIELANKYGIAEFLELHPYETREQLQERLSQAHILLSLPQDSDMAVPSKVYEYMGYPAWLLVMADPGSATWELLEGSEADVVPFRDPTSIETVLGKRLEQFRQGHLPQPIGKAERFRRATFARPFLEFLDTLALQESD